MNVTLLAHGWRLGGKVIEALEYTAVSYTHLVRQIVDEHRAAGLEHANRLVHPSEAPVEVVGSVQFVLVRPVAVVLSKVEWGIGKNRIYAPVPDRRKQGHAVALVHGASFGTECRLHRSWVGGDYRV